MTTEEALERLGRVQGNLMKLVANIESVKILLYSESMPEVHEDEEC